MEKKLGVIGITEQGVVIGGDDEPVSDPLFNRGEQVELVEEMSFEGIELPTLPPGTLVTVLYPTTSYAGPGWFYRVRLIDSEEIGRVDMTLWPQDIRKRVIS